MNRDTAPASIIPRVTRKLLDKVTLTAYDMSEGDIVLTPTGGWQIIKAWTHPHDYGSVIHFEVEKMYVTGDEGCNGPDLGDVEFWMLPDWMPVTFYQKNRMAAAGGES